MADAETRMLLDKEAKRAKALRAQIAQAGTLGKMIRVTTHSGNVFINVQPCAELGDRFVGNRYTAGTHKERNWVDGTLRRFHIGHIKIVEVVPAYTGHMEDEL